MPSRWLLAHLGHPDPCLSPAVSRKSGDVEDEGKQSRVDRKKHVIEPAGRDRYLEDLRCMKSVRCNPHHPQAGLGRTFQIPRSSENLHYHLIPRRITSAESITHLHQGYASKSEWESPSYRAFQLLGSEPLPCRVDGYTRSEFWDSGRVILS